MPSTTLVLSGVTSSFCLICVPLASVYTSAGDCSSTHPCLHSSVIARDKIDPLAWLWRACPERGSLRSAALSYRQLRSHKPGQPPSNCQLPNRTTTSQPTCPKNMDIKPSIIKSPNHVVSFFVFSHPFPPPPVTPSAPRPAPGPILACTWAEPSVHLGRA